MHRNIMVSYDGSDESLRALDEAKELLSTAPGMVLHIVTVITNKDLEPPLDVANYGVNEYQSISPDTIALIHKKMAKQCLARMHERLDALVADVPNTVEFAAVMQTISIAESLTDYVHEHDVDLVIMGCRGLGAIRGVLGSVSYAMLRYSDVPVLIVK